MATLRVGPTRKPGARAGRAEGDGGPSDGSSSCEASEMGHRRAPCFHVRGDRTQHGILRPRRYTSVSPHEPPYRQGGGYLPQGCHHHGKQVRSLSSGTFSKQVMVRGQTGIIALWSAGWMTWLGPCSIPTGLGSEWQLAVSTSRRLSAVRADLLWGSRPGLCPQAAPEGSPVAIPGGTGCRRWPQQGPRRAVPSLSLPTPHLSISKIWMPPMT